MVSDYSAFFSICGSLWNRLVAGHTRGSSAWQLENPWSGGVQRMSAALAEMPARRMIWGIRFAFRRTEILLLLCWGRAQSYNQTSGSPRLRRRFREPVANRHQFPARGRRDLLRPMPSHPAETDDADPMPLVHSAAGVADRSVGSSQRSEPDGSVTVGATDPERGRPVAGKGGRDGIHPEIHSAARSLSTASLSSA